MSVTRTLGGDRLGSGNKMKVHMEGFQRSSHNLGNLFRTTMAAGTLVPFYKKLVNPGDTWDIDLRAELLTHPTLGPLFATGKLQLDMFLTPIRLYNAKVHNNAKGIGRDMAQVKLPQVTFEVTKIPDAEEIGDIDNLHVNPSSLLKYLGYNGFGINNQETPVERTFQGVPILIYWDIVANYYANKQEEIVAYLHTPMAALVQTVTSVVIDGQNMPEVPLPGVPQFMINGSSFDIMYTGAEPNPLDIMIIINDRDPISLSELGGQWKDNGVGGIVSHYNGKFGAFYATGWRYRNSTDIVVTQPAIQTTPISNIDLMREKILQHVGAAPFDIFAQALPPYSFLDNTGQVIPSIKCSQEGLALKTYQSDVNQNWINTEWLDGADGVNTISAIDVSGGLLTMDALNISQKVYNYLNKIAVSGGSYRDWLDVTYDIDSRWSIDSPVYLGGLYKEIIFQEVVSNASTEEQPLGTLAGRGTLGNKHDGGTIVAKAQEPCYLMGIVSITPHIDYSQGNEFDLSLESYADFHIPDMDGIGFQDKLTDGLAWFDTKWDNTTQTWIYNSVGKQPAWIDYMTSYNKVYGNFAVRDNEMFMTFNRRYDYDTATQQIQDLTTYIDPTKFNFIFAETARDSQNYWVQIAINATARRKMSAKLMPSM